jgi:sn-glycerol 3-phosphate transport system substrate-binding protein
VIVGRRDMLGALGGLALTGCRASRPTYRDGRIVVTFWYAFGDVVRKVLLELVARYNAGQDRVWIDAVHQGDYFEALAKLRSALAAGTAPTLSHVVCEVLPYLARAGVLEPLDAYEGVGEIPFVPALDQRGAFAGASGEARVGVPFNRSTPIAFANGDLLAEARVGAPRTWDELVEVAHRLTKPSPGGAARWGFGVPLSWWYWTAMVGQGAGRLVESDGRVSLGGEAGEEAIRFWQRLVDVERVMRPPPGRDYQAWQSQSESFLRGGVAMMWSTTAYVRYLEDTARFPVVAAPLPRRVRASVPTGGTMFVLMRPAPADEKRAAWDFVRWMCRDEQTIEWSTRTGYMPVTRTAVQRLETQGWYRAHPNDRVAYDQLADVDPWPWAPDLFRVERDIVEPRLEDAVLGGRDAHELMDEARDEARRPA